MDFEEFRAAKQAFTEKWGRKMVHGTAEEMEEMRKECAPMARFARIRVEKMLWALGQDWLAKRVTSGEAK